MHDKLVDSWRVDQRQQIVAQRGLNAWPQDEREDLQQIERIAQWIDALAQPASIEHPLHPLKMWVAPGFSPRMAYYFALGDYEEADLELIEKLIKPGDRVLECGGGAGITGSLAAMCSHNPVTVVEPNQQMHPIIERNVQLNGQRCELMAAAVVADDYVEDELTLHVQAEYWWSSVLDKGAGQPVQAPVIRMSDLLEHVNPTVLILDIEGAEVDLLPDRLPAGLRLIMVELHTPDIGDEATASVVNTIMLQGFTLRHLRAQTWAFER